LKVQTVGGLANLVASVRAVEKVTGCDVYRFPQVLQKMDKAALREFHRNCRRLARVLEPLGQAPLNVELGIVADEDETEVKSCVANCVRAPANNPTAAAGGTSEAPASGRSGRARAATAPAGHTAARAKSPSTKTSR
jgi:hypothetical protein